LTAWPAIKTTTGDGLSALAEFRTPAINDAIVRAGVATFLEVGEALARIHAGKQYRELGFASFDAYCQDAAGHGRQWGYQLMAAVKTVSGRLQSGRSAPANEWQARAKPKPKPKPTEAVPVTYDALRDVLPPIEDIAPEPEAQTGFMLVPRPAPLRPTPTPDDSWDGRIVWRATGPVQRYLDKLTELRQATTDLLGDPGNYARYDPTARDVTVGALRATRVKMLKLMKALEPRP
jgi:hypothetical protein